MGGDRDRSLSVAFWNTWLLRPRFFPRGPVLPAADRLFAPDVPRRAHLAGQALAGRFDVVALAECFNAPEQAAVLASWTDPQTSRGPGRSAFRNTGSGLLTVVDSSRAEITYRVRMAYRAGGDLRDSDSFATKGAVLTRVRRAQPPEQAGRRRSHEGQPEIDIVSTHLFAGGELLAVVPGSEDRHRHHGVRMRQVDELLRFIGREHDPHLPLLLVGDLNVTAHDHALASPTERYDDLAARLATVGLVDLWATKGVGPGPTCTFARPDDLTSDPADGDLVADDPAEQLGLHHQDHRERIDYLWLAQPTTGRQVTADRPRRWGFPRPGVHGGLAGTLSDHLALSVTLHLD